MKKIERLKWIENNLGPEFVLKYFLCKNWEEINKAIDFFENQKNSWGMRTDMREGIIQSYLSPFLFHGNRKDAFKIWNKNREFLYYIIYENILVYLCNGVAVRVDEEHIIIEFNDKEPDSPQRDMYKHPQNLRIIGVGPLSMILHPKRHDLLVRCFNPEETMIYSFEIIYRLMIYSTVEEITFSIKPSGKIIIW